MKSITIHLELDHFVVIMLGKKKNNGKYFNYPEVLTCSCGMDKILFCSKVRFDFDICRNFHHRLLMDVVILVCNDG